jgi:iron complex outermembrane receptor protein/outer membrane receptor for ferrienterochelin and colicins
MKPYAYVLITLLTANACIHAQVVPTVKDTLDHNNALEEVIVTSSRTNSRMENTPTRVEVLGLEEMQEENNIKPGNIMSLLGDIAGIQMQQVSASTGNTFARIQGLNGRYTQLLRDGMPLYGGMSGSFGIMQIPPMDLKQIEIIKGSASTLYGGDAIGGIINLVSKNPEFKRDFSFTLNQTSLQETNINGYYSKRNKKVGVTLFVGQTLQNYRDIDQDGLTDVASVNNTIIHPKVLFYFSPKSTLTLNYAGTFDTRRGGDTQYFTHYNTSLYHVATRMQRHSVDAKWQYTINDNSNIVLKLSQSRFDQKLDTKAYVFEGKQSLVYSEASYFRKSEKVNWVAGLNLNGDFLSTNASSLLPMVNDYHNTTVGAFVQNTYKVTEKWVLESGFRYDHSVKFGNFALPRLSLLYKINAALSTRFNGGLGYKSANLLNYIDLETDLAKINAGKDLKAEWSSGCNADVNYKKVFSNGLAITCNQSFFYTSLKNPIVDRSEVQGTIALENANRPLITKGLQSYCRLELDDFELYLGYVYTDVQKQYDAVHHTMVVTPKHNFSTTLFYEATESWRFGIESSWIANQVDENYLNVKDYLLAAAMIQYHFNHITVVANAENIFNFKQSDYGSIYTGTIANPSYVKLWAPIDGRVVNLSLKYSL